MVSRKRPIIAIDGPAGAGKSTVSKKLADTLGFILVDTGAIYRAVALAAQRRGLSWDDAAKVGELAHDLVRAHAVKLERSQAGMRVMLSGEDVSDAIRTPDAGMGASTVSKHPEVRAALLHLQRQAADAGGVVLEGRDIGTVVFPDAEVKFFLTARPDVRAKRRHAELAAKGETVTLEKTLEDLNRRDNQDSMRPVAPLRKADDAIEVDSSDMSLDETVAWMLARVPR